MGQARRGPTRTWPISALVGLPGLVPPYKSLRIWRVHATTSPAAVGPLQARLLADAVLELAQQAADDVPAAVAAEFDVALAIDADHASSVTPTRPTRPGAIPRC